jgi:hypothetical protein
MPPYCSFTSIVRSSIGAIVRVWVLKEGGGRVRGRTGALVTTGVYMVLCEGRWDKVPVSRLQPDSQHNNKETSDVPAPPTSQQEKLLQQQHQDQDQGMSLAAATLAGTPSVARPVAKGRQQPEGVEGNDVEVRSRPSLEHHSTRVGRDGSSIRCASAYLVGLGLLLLVLEIGHLCKAHELLTPARTCTLGTHVHIWYCVERCDAEWFVQLISFVFCWHLSPCLCTCMCRLKQGWAGRRDFSRATRERQRAGGQGYRQRTRPRAIGVAISISLAGSRWW